MTETAYRVGCSMTGSPRVRPLRPSGDSQNTYADVSIEPPDEPQAFSCEHDMLAVPQFAVSRLSSAATPHAGAAPMDPVLLP